MAVLVSAAPTERARVAARGPALRRQSGRREFLVVALDEAAMVPLLALRSLAPPRNAFWVHDSTIRVRRQDVAKFLEWLRSAPLERRGVQRRPLKRVEERAREAALALGWL